MKNETMLSAGIDIGTTTTHLIISKIGIGVTEGFGTVLGVQITSKEIIYKSPVYFTPLLDDGKIDGNAVAKIIESEYESAGVTPDLLKSGAVIVTGESACKENAKDVIDAVSSLAGDFVAAQAGSELESYLSGKGAGADVLSDTTGRCVANADIGGGTTNISFFENGECVDTCCLHIGGRLVKQNSDGTFWIHPILKKICKDNLLDSDRLASGDVELITALCSLLANYIKSVLELKSDIPDCLVCDSLPKIENPPQIITFSGGVAECMNFDKTDFEYGDIGKYLAAAVKKSESDYSAQIVYNNKNPIRATVIGAGQFSMDVSGSTIYCSNAPLPMKNLPCITNLSKISDEPCAVYISMGNAPSFAQVNDLASNIFENSNGLIKNNIPIVVITKEDFSKALGQCLKRKLPNAYPFLCADSIECRNGDYIDIGSPLADGKAVPVVVKTLVFGG